MAVRRYGKVIIDSSALFLCDMQEKFKESVKYFPEIVAISARMLKAAKILNMPVIITEQYPQGLGKTVPELDVTNTKVFQKTRFSMVLPEIEDHLTKSVPNLKSVILCGIETQVCIQQTVLDLLEKKYDVHVIVDACSSRSLVDRMYAFERMREAGAYLTTSESMLLGLVGDAAHPKFKEIQKLIREPAPDTELLSPRL